MTKRMDRDDGFSLVELLIILVIAALCLTMAAPTLSSYLPRIRLTAATHQLASDIACQRLRAVERHQNTSITFDASARTYTLEPYGFRRELPTEIEEADIPFIEFNTRGMTATGDGIIVMLTGQRGNRRGIEIAPAGRLKFFVPTEVVE